MFQSLNGMFFQEKKEGKIKMKKLTFKIWLFIIVLALSLISIFVSPYGFSFFEKGILITSVEPNSTAFQFGLRQGQIITSIDGNLMNNITDYANYMQSKFPSQEAIKIIITTKESAVTLYSDHSPNITVSPIPKTSLKAGLDLAGGARALVRAENKSLSSSEINDLVSITLNRFNVYGLSDIKVRAISDLSGNRFMLIEIAGATPNDLRSLIENQGKFEAKIGNETVFVGGNKDVSSVCRNDATCARIESCDQDSSGGYFCKFSFSIYLSEEAARRHADITSKIDVNATNPGYLSKPLDLYVDNNLVESLLISKELKGEVTTQISVSGSGSGATRDDAYKAAEESMHKLQTILITGSLPYKLEIAKLDTISPLLGQNFVKYILLAGVVALISASLIIFIRYRKLKQSLTVILISLAEIIIILGISALIDWNLDLASIAGILASIGTGFDDQIVILDESLHKTSQTITQKIKNAFAIIMGAYFTVLVSLLPLMWAGGGLLKGFAITTIIGISIGVFITRPAFGDIIKMMGE
jgi:preprotein translocase subunit SecD